MFEKEIQNLEEMMIDYCEYNPMIFAQQVAFRDESVTQKTFTYGNFSIGDYLKSYS